MRIAALLSLFLFTLLASPAADAKRNAECGNGVVERGEQCDDGNTTAGDGCDAACRVEPICGDGVIDAGEECDDGNNDNGDGCDAVCRVEKHEPPPPPPPVAGNVRVHVVAMDQVIVYNRLGVFNPAGMIYALARDVFPRGTSVANQKLANSCAAVPCTPGQVELRHDKRPRPLTLRANEGQTISIEFTNLLRKSGVRVSVAEAIDAFQSLDELTLDDREVFKDALLWILLRF